VPDSVKAYPDQPDTSSGVQNGRPTGLKTQNIAVIPSKPGKLVLPEMKLSWWDINADKQREVTLPARTVTVLPAAGGAPTAAPAAPSTASSSTPPANGSNQETPASTPLAVPGPAGTAEAVPATPPFWRWLSLALAAGWLLTVLAWIVTARRRRASPAAMPAPKAPSVQSPDAKAEKAAFVQACQSDDPIGARRHLLAWARAENPETPPAGLGALAKALAEADIAAELERLDRACYAGGEWQGAALANRLTSVRLNNRKTARASALGSLYS